MSKKKPSFAVVSAGVLLLWWQTSAALIPTFPQPNLYEFTGQDVQVSYSTSSFTGEPLLSYRDSQRKLNFRGSEIRVARSEIGQQVSVTLEQIPDLQTITFTLLIPDINLDRNPVLFKTIAIATTHKTSIGGPALVGGALQSYKTEALLGAASQVYFIQATHSGVMGEVTLSPICPGPQQLGQICVAPYADAAVQIVDPSGVVVAAAKTNSLGLFKVDVPQGGYRVHIDSISVWPSCPELPVAVPMTGYASVQVNCDTGIR